MSAYSMENFITDMEGLVAKGDEAILLSTGASLMERLVEDLNVVPAQFRNPAANGERPNHGTFVCYTGESGLSITTVVWGPGDGIPPHDHHTWGLIGVASNAITESRYLRLDGGTDTTLARLELEHVAVMKAGQVSTLALGTDEIHAMQNTTTAPTIEVHAYGLDLKGLDRCMFDIDTGRITRFATKAYDND
jgi:predicted metal-dependent enzyme (double-stranded beta helix superfamily)